MFFISFKKRYPNTEEYFNLLPRYFKWIGLGVIALSLFNKIIINALAIPYFIAHPEDRIQLGSKLFIMGLFLFCFAKEKFEDDTINRMRLKAMAQSVAATIFYYFITLSGGGFGDEGNNLMAVGVYIIMFLFIYIILFNLKKYKNNKRNEKLDKRREGQKKDDPGRTSESAESVEALD